MNVELDDHQLKALGKLHNGSILKGGVGSGKSRTSIAYYFTSVCGAKLRINGVGETTPMSKPRDLYVITTARKRNDKDWEGEAANFSISSDRDISFGGVKLVVDSWNNIDKYKDVKDAFFIFDEQRLVGSGAWVKTFLKIVKTNQWILLSATPGDQWIEYVPVFVANGFYKNRSEFIIRHVVYNRFSKFPKIDRYIETGRLEKLRRSITVDMPFTRTTVRHIRTVPVEYDQDKTTAVLKQRWHIFEDRPLKDAGEMFQLLRKVANSDVSRLGAVMTIFEQHPKLIIFYNFNYELEMLRTLGSTLNVEVREWNGHKHESVPEGDRWIYLVQYTAGAEGWNCITTNAMVFFSLNYSYKINEQAKGRIDRMNTPFKDLYYYILVSGSAIDKAIQKALKRKTDFNEKSFSKFSME